jgi:hypothetical protein
MFTAIRAAGRLQRDAPTNSELALLIETGLIEALDY